MIGGFFDRYHAGWTPSDLDWFEALLEEDDVEIMAWALGSVEAPQNFAGPLMQALQRLDYVTI